jgi:uncharacterized protein CbrC (UPF0167 family)
VVVGFTGSSFLSWWSFSLRLHRGTDLTGRSRDRPAESSLRTRKTKQTRTATWASVSGWQQEHWLYHCGDAAAFLGRVGWAELQSHPDAVESLRQEHGADARPAEEVDEHLTALEKEGEATAYLFRCRHCGRQLAYSDSA